MSKKKKRSQVLSDIMGALPHMARLPRVGPIKVATPFVSPWEYVHPPPATGQQAINHRASSHPPIAQRTRRRHRPATDYDRSAATGHGSPATVQMGITWDFQSVNDRSLTIQPPVIGVRKSQYRGKFIFTVHQSPVNRPMATGQQTFYINLQLVELMP